MILKRNLVFTLALLATRAAFAQTPVVSVPPPCNAGGTANYSATIGSSSQAFIPAPPAGVTRTGVFIQCLAATCVLGLNLTGGTASITAAGNLVVSGQYAVTDSNVWGFIPQGAITAIAPAGSTVVTAFACPS